ncbi:FtsL-like putative cell division protein [Kaistella palustris]|uniref:FtsL-like putative cell division protein n=1 Tax=Kaistella palustris TaxID=493376 RepID=UPI000427F6D5|nr:FtsL-like putative cell division protein [Kaistella palustris]
MAKKPTYRTQKKLTFIDLVKGNFLNRDEVKIHYKYFLLVFVLLMVMIYSNHLVSQKIEMVNELKEQTEEFKSRNAYAQSRLIKVKLESELGKEMVQDSLLSLENHPHKLLVKLDSTDGGAK